MVNRVTVMQQVRHLNRDQMKRWVEQQLGKPITEAKFKKLMFQYIPLETYYQERIIKAIKNRYPDAFVRKISAGPYSEAGFPDVLVIRNGLYFGIEVKRPIIGELSELQEQTIKDIWAAGGKVCVASFPENALEMIEQWTKKTANR